MTDNPDRTIKGLPPRRTAPAADLLRANRTAPAPPPADEHADPRLHPAEPLDRTGISAQERDDLEALEEAAVAAAAARAKRKRPRQAKRTPASGKVQIAADVQIDTRDRAKAAFRAAAYFEGVGSFSAFVERALEREIARMENAHNDGEPFEPVRENLTAGRPSS